MRTDPKKPKMRSPKKSQMRQPKSVLGKHDFFDFMNSARDGLAQEYERIERRVHEDPGTAGDQGEENWATLLRNWLPANYPIVTKGRIIGFNGATSPQVDVLVLHPSYPHALRDKKLYFVGGVVAAFECKLRLRQNHLLKAIENAAIIKSLLAPREGNPYDELHQPIVYGLLAHTHDWNAKGREAVFTIVKAVEEYYGRFLESSSKRSPELCHPRYMLDLVCSSDIVTIGLTKSIHMGPVHDEEREDLFGEDPLGGVSTSYLAQWETAKDPYNSRGDILGALIRALTVRFAFEDPSLRSIANYIERIGLWGGVGQVTTWKPNVFSDAVVSILVRGGLENTPWSKWQRHF